MNKIKYIIRECEPEITDFSWFFGDEGLTAAGGDYCYNIFIIENRYNGGFNVDEYRELTNECENILTEIDDLQNGYSAYKNIKDIMIDYHLHYSPKNAHILKALSCKPYRDFTQEILIDYLSIKTGEKWNIATARGYSQGDYNTILYCEKYNTPEQINIIGDLWQGCAKEFCLVSLDDQKNEIDSCFGYFVADCQARTNEDYKKIVCNDAGIDENETSLEVITGSHNYIKYDYITI